MLCPKCGSEELSVVDSRSDGEAIRRRRECQNCRYRFSTYERIEYSLPPVVKKDGRREPFDSAKIKSGLVKACEKRAVSVETIDRTVEEIERRVREQHLKEIPSRQIGDYVMEALRNLDQIAYVRFASVYREFSDISQFIETLQGLVGQKTRLEDAGQK